MNTMGPLYVLAQTNPMGRVTDVKVSGSPLVLEARLHQQAGQPNVRDIRVFEWPGNWSQPCRPIEWVDMDTQKHFYYIGEKDNVIARSPINVR